MKIADIRIDGFGVWHDLTLRGLSPEVTVFYGPNEAGKSTLMNFLRTVLYGVTPSRRKRKQHRARLSLRARPASRPSRQSQKLHLLN
jgi:uncharacterized protein YhaN